MNYYNENDPFAAAWLRNLIAAGHISKGEVDERSIVDVKPEDLKGFTQCHFFAGIGVWSYALRLAGWPDDRPVWTGSCPCQPFSAAGQRKGFDDARHLWPQWFRLIQEHRPVTVLGEQVASALSWLDLVSGDLEGEGYAVGTAVLGAHSVGAPHIRQRIYWAGTLEYATLEQEGIPGRAWESRSAVADSPIPRRTGTGEHECGPPSPAARLEQYGELGIADGKGHAFGVGQQGNDGTTAEAPTGQTIVKASYRSAVELGISNGSGPLQRNETAATNGHGHSTLPTSFWSDCSWLPCIDGKSRPVEPGTFPLAHGSPARVGRLRGYGNALVAQQAEVFVRAYLETL